MTTDPVTDLDSIGIREILDHDSRPTFVIDLDPDEEAPPDTHSILPVFCNSALRLHERLYDAVTGKNGEASRDDEKPTYSDFKSWATVVTPHDDSKDPFPLSFLYGDLLWTGSTVRQRWRLISGNLLWGSSGPLHDLSSGAPLEVSTGGLRAEQEASKQTVSLGRSEKQATARTEAESSTLVSSTHQAALKPFYFTKTSTEESSTDTGESSKSQKSIVLFAPDKAVPDWTVSSPQGLLSPHLVFARKVDWASTPLGPIDTWSPEFRQAANLVMTNPHPASLFWGSELTLLYNEAYAAEVAGNKHPSLMGTGFSGPFSELWDAVAPVFAECARTGISVRRENDYLPIERHGFLEETFYSWSLTPLYGGTHRILGFYNAPFETTQQVLNHRRMQTINKLGGHTAAAKTVKQFWKQVLAGLEDNHFDVPFALLYSVGEGEDGDHSSISSGSTIPLKSCYFEGSIAVPDGHIAAPHQLDLKRSREGFVPSFREAMRTREPTLLRTRDGTLPEALLEGINWRGFEDPCREAIIFPVRPTNGEMVLAFLLIGVNPRRPYDDGYKDFSSMLNRQLATSLASVILFEDEVRKSRDAAEAAALEQEQLTQQLAMQTSRLRRMTELSPLGMFLISPEGVLQEANDRFFEMTGLPRESLYEMSWMECINNESTKTMDEGWHRMVIEHVPWSGELQLKKGKTKPVNFNGEPIEYWVMLTAQPEFASESSLRSIMGSITDISHLKWAQGLQNRRLEEAEETRRQQNEFIDITSHEMRNPLSAILQCAEDISSALEQTLSKALPPTQSVVESCVDAAHTIALCTQHQKLIVDDILTISKLDSNLLVITPVPAQPVAVAKRAVKMFDAELQAKDITVVFDIHRSIQDLDVDWITLDPSRVLQILINLMTNAIKFTADSEKRVITVRVAASLDPPRTLDNSEFQYIRAKTANANIVRGEDWGVGQVVYLRFKVQDTGCGLTRADKQVLFERFSQASPRTHAQYGGSGLGLFISRQLAELHGGQIGVASEAGLGSTFGFFIKARKTNLSLSPSDTNLAFASSPSLDASLAHRPDLANIVPLTIAGSMATASAAFNPKELHILVVEDNLINQKVLVKQLTKHGCSVAVANDGVEALAFLSTTHYLSAEGQPLSVILMDLEMPNMDGLTCVRRIRKMEEDGEIRNGKRVPILAVTANVRDEQVIAARKSGMDDLVSKPFRIAELFKKIEDVLKATGRIS
jgi:PAS domain S-box-containing protein